MPAWSAIKPCTGGSKAPPTTAVNNKADALPVKLPSPSIANVKIVGDIIDIKPPIPTNNTGTIIPDEVRHILNNNKTTIPQAANAFAGFIYFKTTTPIKPVKVANNQ